jgi:eukaryotic-like serine/threonine-protein kinase
MPLLSGGDKLGQYQILASLGAGGMGEVYRARDTQLERDVAIKVLPRTLAADPERLARFDREAKILAALNHPNIAVIYGLVESEAQRALVMELVPGETLGDRIKRGAMPLDETLQIVGQIAEALEAAHEKGIVHRDLKPANVMLTPTGLVKVLDFGLAAMTQAGPSTPGDPGNSPTLTLGMTQAGAIMGTAAYMAPEQAAGTPVDRRADIWSYGVVLWEMLTGKRLFRGDTVAHTLAGVLQSPIEFDRVIAPKPIKELLRRCLDRDVKTRLRDIGEARVTIARYLADPVSAPEAVGETAPSPSRLGTGVGATAAVLAVALAGLGFVHFRETPPAERTLRYTIALPENGGVHSLAISPDGRYVVIAPAAGKRQLWLRPLDALQAQPMPTTEDATYPFWSPDSRYIGFFAQGKLRKIAVSGGPSQSLCDASGGRGGTWNRDDVILFSPGFNENVIRRVSAAGGVPSDVTKTSLPVLFPTFLPDGRHFLYVTVASAAEQNGIYVASLDGKENRRVLPDASSPVFAPAAGGDTGRLLFVRENNLMALPFNAGSRQASGDVFPVAEGVSLVQNNFEPVSVSESGVLLYWSGGSNSGAGSNQIVWFDRSGKLLEPALPQRGARMPSISPDEKMIAFARRTGTSEDIWLRDLVRGTDRRFTSDPSQNLNPFWSPKGDRIVYRSNRGGKQGDLYQKATSGSGQDEVLLSNANAKVVTQWSRDGRFIVYFENDRKTRQDLWVFPVGDAPSGKTEQKPVVFLKTEFNEIQGQLSPDSRWMAYSSDVSGMREVYVRPFPSADVEVRISTAGGEQPRWRGDGKELYYVSADGKLTAVAVKASAGPKPVFDAGTPVPLFDAHLAGLGVTVYFNYDVTADGKRFLAITDGATAATGASAPPLTVVTNWTAGLKR